jgi:uncharacterized protein YcbK (DUF882 family)
MKDETARNSESSLMMNRRHFLKLGVLTAAAAAAFPIAASARARLFPERTLNFYNIHTGEHLRAAYWTEGGYQSGVLDEINFLLRDYRTGEVKAIDPSLLDLLHSVNHVLKSSQSFHVVSGYRSAATNAMLAERSSGVAKHSMHIEGKAIDVYLPDRSLRDLHRVALALRKGGVGYYPESDFVHMDVGRVRSW